MSPAEPFQHALTLDEHVALHPLDAGCWMQLGVAAFEAGDRERAVWALSHAAELDVSDSKCREMLASAALAAQRWDIAQRVRRQLLDNFPNSPQTHVIDGHLQKMQGRIPEAGPHLPTADDSLGHAAARSASLPITRPSTVGSRLPRTCKTY